MSQALHSYDRLVAAHFSDEQARAILDAMTGDLVTREYLDARLAALRLDLTREIGDTRLGLHKEIADARNAMLAFVFVVVGLATSLLLFALPRLIVAAP